MGITGQKNDALSSKRQLAGRTRERAVNTCLENPENSFNIWFSSNNRETLYRHMCTGVQRLVSKRPSQPRERNSWTHLPDASLIQAAGSLSQEPRLSRASSCDLQQLRACFIQILVSRELEVDLLAFRRMSLRNHSAPAKTL